MREEQWCSSSKPVLFDSATGKRQSLRRHTPGVTPPMEMSPAVISSLPCQPIDSQQQGEQNLGRNNSSCGALGIPKQGHYGLGPPQRTPFTVHKTASKTASMTTTGGVHTGSVSVSAKKVPKSDEERHAKWMENRSAHKKPQPVNDQRRHNPMAQSAPFTLPPGRTPMAKPAAHTRPTASSRRRVEMYMSSDQACNLFHSHSDHGSRGTDSVTVTPTCSRPAKGRLNFAMTSQPAAKLRPGPMLLPTSTPQPRKQHAQQAPLDNPNTSHTPHQQWTCRSRTANLHTSLSVQPPHRTMVNLCPTSPDPLIATTSPCEPPSSKSHFSLILPWEQVSLTPPPSLGSVGRTPQEDATPQPYPAPDSTITTLLAPDAGAVTPPPTSMHRSVPPKTCLSCMTIPGSILRQPARRVPTATVMTDMTVDAQPRTPATAKPSTQHETHRIGYKARSAYMPEQATTPHLVAASVSTIVTTSINARGTVLPVDTAGVDTQMASVPLGSIATLTAVRAKKSMREELGTQLVLTPVRRSARVQPVTAPPASRPGQDTPPPTTTTITTAKACVHHQLRSQQSSTDIHALLEITNYAYTPNRYLMPLPVEDRVATKGKNPEVVLTDKSTTEDNADATEGAHDHVVVRTDVDSFMQDVTVTCGEDSDGVAMTSECSPLITGKMLRF